MAAVSTLAIIGLGVTAAGMVMQNNAQNRAQRQSEQAANEQRQGRAVSAAQAAQQAGAERRQQIREERIKRAQIENSAELTGTSGSSAEIGATGGMATTLGSNLGTNTGARQAGQMITGFSQRAADFNSAAQRSSGQAAQWGQVAGLGSSMFAQVGGWKTLFSK